jgi:hypothetical protein
MQKFKLLFVLAVALFFTACDNNNSAAVDVDADEPIETKEDKAPTESGMTSGLTKVVDAVADLSVQLDNGEKWQANSETTEGIYSMIRSTKELMSSGSATIEDYRTLGVSLQKDFNTIFEKCTMTGESHEQLHNYLLPMVDMVKTFEEKDIAACDKALPEFKDYLGSYFQYFN